MSALVCFEVGALRVNLAAAVEVTPVYPPLAVGGRVPTDESRLFRAFRYPAAAATDFDRQVQVAVASCPAAHDGLRGGRRRADDGGAKRSGARQNRAQRVGGEAVRGRELLGTVRRLAAGVRVHAVAVQNGAVLIVLLVGRRQFGAGLSLGLVAARQDQLTPQVLLAVKL